MKMRNLICGAMSVLFVAATNHVDGQDYSPEPTVDSKHTNSALKVMSDSTRFIEAATVLSARGDFGGELILENGQLVEHGSTFTFIFSRPAKLYLKLNSRDGSETKMFFDGKTITVASIVDDLQIYDTAPQPGDVNESLDFMVGQTGGPRELNHFLTEQLTDSLSRQVETGFSLGNSTIDGVLCEHLALRSDTRDGQVWVEKGDEPAPRRILITHRNKPGQPRFWVQFDEWEFTPNLNASTFRYTPPEGAIKFRYFGD